MPKNLLPSLLIGIILMGGFLRVYNLGATSLQSDEIFTAVRARSNLASIFVKTAEEAGFGYAPIDRLFVHFALYFGEGEFVIRFPSVIFGLLSIWLIYRVGKAFFNENIGLIGSFLLSLSTLHLEYSQEARYYAYVVFFFLASLLFYYDLLKKLRIKYLLLFIVTVFGGVLSHLTSLIFLIVQILFALTVWLKEGGRTSKWASGRHYCVMVSIGGIFFTLLLCYLRDYLSLLKAIRIDYSPDLLALASYTAVKLSGGSGWILGVYLSFFILGFWVVTKKYRLEAILLTILLFLPPVLLFFVRPVGYTFHIRYVIFVLPVYLLFVAVGLDFFSGYLRKMAEDGSGGDSAISLKRWATCLPSLSVLTIAGVISAQNYYQRPLEDWRGLGKYLRENAQDGDIVITENPYRKMTVEYYFKWDGESSLVKTTAESLTRIKKYPFRRYFLQHDYISSSGLFDPEALPLTGVEGIKAFRAGTVSMYLLNSPPIWFWQEAEIGSLENEGWYISDYWGKKTMGTDSLTSPSAFLVYKFELTRKGIYDLYANLRWDGARGSLKYKIDNGRWSQGLQPFYGEKGNVVSSWRWKEAKLGSHFLEAGKHQITFLNQKTLDEIDRYQTIDYFYLTLN